MGKIIIKKSVIFISEIILITIIFVADAWHTEGWREKAKAFGLYILIAAMLLAWLLMPKIEVSAAEPVGDSHITESALPYEGLNLRADVDFGSEVITLKWDKSKSKGCTYYVQKTTCDTMWEYNTIKKTKKRGCVDEINTDSCHYTYEIWIEDIYGDTWLGDYIIICLLPTDKPYILAVSTWKNMMKVGWEHVPGATKYKVSIKPDGERNYKTIATVKDAEEIEAKIPKDIKGNFTVKVQAYRKVGKLWYAGQYHKKKVTR